MIKIRKFPLFAAALLVGAGWAFAQDDGAVPAEDAASADSSEPAAAEAAPAAPVKPRDSELMPLAKKGMLLDIVNTGAHIVAVGERGNVLLSNNGKDWAQAQTPARATLTAVTFVDDKHGWAVGHDAVILGTEDGGKTWKLQNFMPELEKPFLDVLFLDASTGFAVGAYGLLYKTSDSGATWTEVDAASIRGDEVHFNGITKLNDGSLLITGEQGMIGHSADSGATWSKLTSPYEASLFGALPQGEKGAIIFGLRGNAYSSTDVASNTWTKIETNTVNSLFGGVAMPDGRVAMVGLNAWLMLVDPATGASSALGIKIKEEGRDGSVREKNLSSTLSAALPFNGGMLVVGEEGVSAVSSLQ